MSPADELGRELYDHRDDDGSVDWPGENTNLAAQPEHADLVKQLHQQVLAYIRL